MASTITGISFILLQMICVIMVIAYPITRSASFTAVLERRSTLKDRLILLLVFGAVSIYGTESGIDILGAPVNVRDLGPTMIAGLTCGPVVGLGAGLAGGAIYVRKKGEFVRTGGAVLFAVGIESLYMGLVLPPRPTVFRCAGTGEGHGIPHDPGERRRAPGRKRPDRGRLAIGHVRHPLLRARRCTGTETHLRQRGAQPVPALPGERSDRRAGERRSTRMEREGAVGGTSSV